MGYYYVAMMTKRMFYYVPFKMGTSATAACGLNYNGIDKEGNHQWDKIVGMYVWKIEFATNPM